MKTRRSRLHLCTLLVGAVTLFAACGTVAPNASTTSQVVPWVNTPVSHISNTAAVGSSLVPTGRPCSTSQLSVRSGPGGGQAQNVVESFIFTDTSSKSCWLRGWPKVVLLGPHGESLSAPKVVQSPETGTSSQPPALVLTSGMSEGLLGAPPRKGQAVVQLVIPSSMVCATPVAAIRFVLPGSSIGMTPVQTTGEPHSSRLLLSPPSGPSSISVPTTGCTNSPDSGPNMVSVSPFFNWADAPPGSQRPLVIDLEVAYLHVGTATAGKQLEYEVRLTNVSGNTMSFSSSCPSYGEYLKFLGSVPSGLTSLIGAGNAIESHYMLNCSAIGALQNGASVTLAMQLPIPANLASAIPVGGVPHGLLGWFISNPPTLVSGGGGGPHPLTVTLHR